MFEDTKEELARLQEELLEDEEKPEAPIGDTQVFTAPDVQAYSRAYNADATDIDPEELGDALDTPDDGMRGLVIAVIALTAAIVLVAGWMTLKCMGWI